jgi:uncharacterized protein
MEILGLIQDNLLTPIVLFFILGIVAARIKSDLKIPEAISEFLPIYLLAAIGLHGGMEMRKTGFESMLIPMIVAIALSLAMTMNHYQILRKLGKFNIFDSYALASTYGAVGAVTFSVGLSFLKNQGIESEGYIAAILAVLEPLAFILAIFMTNMAVSKQMKTKKQTLAKGDAGEDFGIFDSQSSKATLSHVLRDSITGKAVVILIGSIVIGYVIGDEGFAPIKILFEDLFVGAIVIFLIEMGIIAGQRLDDVKKVGAFLIGFSIVIPTLNGIIGVFAATFLGLSVGGAVMFGLLLASASFIAAPAVLRTAIPQAKPSLYITSALGITFPYNIIILLPIMLTISLAISEWRLTTDLFAIWSNNV